MTTYVTPDRGLAVVIDDDAMRSLVEHCVRAGRKETGGILIGRYTDPHDQAIVTCVTGPPRDSIRRRLSFIRGLAGLQRRIDQSWVEGRYYLGEWHFHPYMAPTPSDRDRTQIVGFSKDPAYACPEPILLVVGGDPNDDPQLRVAVVKDEVLHDFLPSGDLDATKAPLEPADKPE